MARLCWLVAALAGAGCGGRSATRHDGPPGTSASEGGGERGEGGGEEGGGEAREGGEEGGGGVPDASPYVPDASAPRSCGTKKVICVRPDDSIARALENAPKGATIQVAAGTYREHLKLSGKRGIELVGGFSEDFSTRDPDKTPTVLVGSKDEAVIWIAGGSKLRIEGFTIKGGRGHMVGNRAEGGGIYIEEGARDISIVGNEITGCDVYRGKEPWEGKGGAISSDARDTKIVGNRLTKNQAGRGAGIFMRAGGLIEGNLIEENVGRSDHAGGLSVAGKVRIRNNIIRGNKVGDDYGWGGGLLVVGGETDAVLEGNLVTDNHAPSSGSGVFVDEGARAVLRHELYVKNRCNKDGGVGFMADGGDGIGSVVEIVSSTIAWNDCGSVQKGGNGVISDQNSKVTVKDSIFWENGGKDFYTEEGGTISVTYSLTSKKQSGTGNLSDDPLFVDPKAGDFHLRSEAGRWDPRTESWVKDGSSSPALDRGDPGAEYDREPTPNGGRINLGHTGNTRMASKSR